MDFVIVYIDYEGVRYFLEYKNRKLNFFIELNDFYFVLVIVVVYL